MQRRARSGWLVLLIMVLPFMPSWAQESRKNQKDGAEMAWVPAGEFLMGADSSEIDRLWKRYGWLEKWKRYTTDEAPMHRIRLTKGFWLYKAPVTVAQYRTFCRQSAREMPEQPEDGKQDHPVVNVTWEDAKA